MPSRGIGAEANLRTTQTKTATMLKGAVDGDVLHSVDDGLMDTGYLRMHM